MFEYNLGEIKIESRLDAKEAFKMFDLAIGHTWIGMFKPSPELIELQQEEDEAVAAGIPKDGFVPVGKMVLFEEGYIIPAWENILERLLNKTGSWVYMTSRVEPLIEAYKKQYEKIENLRNSIIPKVSGSMSRRKH